MIVRAITVCLQWLMSFGAINSCNHKYYPTELTPDLSKQILYEIDNSVDLSKFNLSKMVIEFDIENPLDLPCYVNKKEITRFEKKYDNDSFEFINMILWEFLRTNQTTKTYLALCDEIIQRMDQQHNCESEIEMLIQEQTNLKSFASFKTMLLKDHGIEFEEYHASYQGKLKTFHKQQFSHTKIAYLPIDYELPILKKLSPSMYIEISPDMDATSISKRIQSIIHKKQSPFMERLPSKNTARILHDALIIYKYLQLTNYVYEKAVRYLNFHLLQTFGLRIPKKEYISLKDRAQGAKEPLCKIETDTNLELSKHRISERKKVISEIEALLKLPKTGQ